MKTAYALKLALFFTGISGIVAEFILSTLASYFLGDSLVQWTLILSVMLFSMGLGSRLSKYISDDLLFKLVGIELLLSLLVSFSPVFIYTISGFTNFDGPIIYLFSLVIGCLIGLEIPLAVRINEEYEPLRLNVSSILEKDYFGSLVGGVFFAFIGLPLLGVVNTAIILGLLNFVVALILVFILKEYFSSVKLRVVSVLFTLLALVYLGSIWFVKPVILHGEQNKYKDTIVYQEQSQYQKITLTQYKSDYWLFINGNLQLSTFDQYMYHEPMVHPAMFLAKANKVLVIGGGDGFTANEILKYNEVESVYLVDLDKKMTDFGKNNPAILKHNNSALRNQKVTIINKDGFNFLKETDQFFDVIIVDLIDAKNIDINKLYTKEFYEMVSIKLRDNGILVTQAGNPFVAEKAFHCVDKTIESAGFNTIKYQNEVNTMGKRGWIIGSKTIGTDQMYSQLTAFNLNDVPTKWLNNSGMNHMLHFGKVQVDTTLIDINTLNNPVLYHYFLGGNWDMQ